MSIIDINSGYTGFYVWRIEKLQPVLVSSKNYGTFFNGDAYIVYCCSEYREPGGSGMRPKPHNGLSVEQHIHFWLGENSSVDEVTTAAYKTVELDRLLGGFPVQHREVQGFESKRFRSYFRDPIRILQGGVSTGLSRTPEKTAKLYMVKGRRQPMIMQLDDISWSKLNRGDVFVLDAITTVFVWSGKDANKYEKLQASKVALKLKSENGISTIVYTADGKEDDMAQDEKEIFEKYFPLGKKKVSEAIPDSDDQFDVNTRKTIKLYHCTDEMGTPQIREIKTGPLEQQDLNSNDSFIVDNGTLGIWAWIGRKASQTERTEALRNAQGFISKKGYQFSVPITRVIDGGEPAEFQSLFKDWKDKYHSSLVLKSRKYSPTVQTENFNAATLHENPRLAAETGMFDDGSGEKEIFRVKRFELVRVPKEEFGILYSGDSYVMLYTYYWDSKECHVIYYWLGSKSSQDERATAALKAVEIDDGLGGKAVQVRVVQGKEPIHFLAVFRGCLRIFDGGFTSTFDERSGKVRGPANVDAILMQVHGKSPISTYAIQVPLEAASLNTNDCFVLKTKQEIFLWMGKGSTGDEREMAKEIGMKDSIQTTMIYEGQEKDYFWNLLGGKGMYFSEREISKHNSLSHRQPRLFHCSNASGRFKVEEIFNFNQMDLIPEDVMILDVWTLVFVWVGQDANIVEREQAIITAKEYLESDPSGRDTSVAIVVVKEGHEPLNFTGRFGLWDKSLWDQSYLNLH